MSNGEKKGPSGREMGWGVAGLVVGAMLTLAVNAFLPYVTRSELIGSFDCDPELSRTHTCWVKEDGKVHTEQLRLCGLGVTNRREAYSSHAAEGVEAHLCYRVEGGEKKQPLYWRVEGVPQIDISEGPTTVDVYAFDSETRTAYVVERLDGRYWAYRRPLQDQLRVTLSARNARSCTISFRIGADGCPVVQD